MWVSWVIVEIFINLDIYSNLNYIKINLLIMNKNIKLFKNCYFLLIILCSLIQIIIGETIDDFIILGIVITLNLLILFYCIDENKFNKFPISLSVIFFSVFINSSSSLFFKTIELDKVSSNLISPMDTFTFLFYANILIIISHFFL